MKTGGTMNFLKRAGAILMVVAIFASSCNKYADDFDQVNTKLDALATQVAGISTITTDMSAIKSQITSLQTAIASLPTATQQTAQFAAVTTSLTAMTTAIAAIDTQVKAVATSGTVTAAAVAKLSTDLASLSAKVAADNATLVKNTNDALTKITALDTKVTGLDTKMTDMATTMTALATAVAKVQMGVDVNTAGIAGLVVKLNDQATAVAKIGTDLTALAVAANNAAAINAAANVQFAADNAKMMADLVKVAADVAKASQTGATGDAVTALTIAGLQAMLNAQKAQLDIILANTALKMVGVTIAGNAVVGGVLKGTVDPATATATYQWSSSSTLTGSYVDIADAKSLNYTILPGDKDKFLKLTVTGTGNYLNTSVPTVSVASAKIGAQILVTTAGTLLANNQVGLKLTAPTPTTNPTTTAAQQTLSYQWEASSALLGIYTPIAGATKADYTIEAAYATMYIRVTTTGIEGMTGSVTTNGVGPVSFIGKTSAPFNMVVANNTITVTVTDGKFKTVANGLSNSQFSMVGTGTTGTTLTTGVTFTRVDDYTVTFVLPATFNLASAYTIAVSENAMASQVTSVTAVGSTAVMSTMVGGGAIAVTAPVLGATPQSVIVPVGTGWTATIAWSGSPVTFASGTAYTATITITPNAGYTLAGTAADYVTVPGATGGNTGTKFVLAGSGSVKAVFPATGLIPIDIAAMPLPVPISGAGIISSISTAQYTAAVTWAPVPVGAYDPAVTYTATVQITPVLGYTVVGVPSSFFTVAGSTTVTYLAGADNLTVAFPATAVLNVPVAAVTGISTPVALAVVDAIAANTAAYTAGAVTWATGANHGAVGSGSPVATVTLTAAAGYQFNTAANAFTVAGAVVTHAATVNAATVTLTITYPAL